VKNIIEVDKSKTICFSGPRPIKYEYSGKKLEKINFILYSEITGLLRAGFNTLIFGGAPGFDLISLKAALRIKEETEYKNIQLICALPYEKFSESQHFDDYWLRWYNEIIPHCKIINVGKSIEAFPGCFRKRNYFMVDNSAALICLYNGQPGGTGQTYLYAVRKKLQIINIYKRVEKADEE